MKNKIKFFFSILPLIFLLFSCRDNEKGLIIKRNSNGDVESILIESRHKEYDNIYLKINKGGYLDSLKFMHKNTLHKNDINFYDDGGIKKITQYYDTDSSFIQNQMIYFDRNLNIIEDLSLFAIIRKENEKKQGEIAYYSTLGNEYSTVSFVDSIESDFLTYRVDSNIRFSAKNSDKKIIFNLSKPYTGIMFSSYFDSTYKTATGFYIKLN